MLYTRLTRLAVLITAGKYRNPSRTPKSSPQVAMVLHSEVWKSSLAQPLFFYLIKSEIIIISNCEILFLLSLGFNLVRIFCSSNKFIKSGFTFLNVFLLSPANLIGWAFFLMEFFFHAYFLYIRIFNTCFIHILFSGLRLPVKISSTCNKNSHSSFNFIFKIEKEATNEKSFNS